MVRYPQRRLPPWGSGGVVWLGSTTGAVQTWSDTQVTASVATGAVTGIARIQQNGVWSKAFVFIVLGGSGVTLVPNLLNMLVGDTHTIEALGSNGQPVTGLTWTTSDATVVSLSSADPPLLTAVAAGHVTITAGGASADVTVSAGALPLGTVLWSNPGTGCVNSIVPAVPSPSGVADVFAFSCDYSTVQAITSDGTTAWTASVNPYFVPPNFKPIPDFLGGLLGTTAALDNNNNLYVASVVRFDGMTGQSQVVYTPPVDSTSPNAPYLLRAHPDGTIFMVQQNPTFSINGTLQGTVSQVVGINPSGGQKFSVPLWSGCVQSLWGQPNFTENSAFYDSIIAGDGYYYLAYACLDQAPFASLPDGTNEFMIHLRLIRVDSSGNFNDIHVADFPSVTQIGPLFVRASLITNADQGVVLNWYPFYSGSTAEQPLMALTTGTSVSVVNGPQLPNQTFGTVINGIVQLQDGSFAGTVQMGQTLPLTNSMIAFDQTGAVRWIAPNEPPLIATEDGGVIGQ
jgi:hypothetical protein